MKNANLLDQFFLNDQKIIDDFILAAELKESDVILEIGAGRGVLTKLLLKKAKKVIAVEKDVSLKKELLQLQGNLLIVIGDALTYIKAKKAKFNKIIGNLPSSIIEPLMNILIKTDFESAVFLVPLRFAGKLKQSVYFDSKLICKVDRKSFLPVPKTNWALVRIVKKIKLGQEEFLNKYLLEHPLAKKENALREGLISYYKSQGKKLTKNQAREIIKSQKPAEPAGFI